MSGHSEDSGDEFLFVLLLLAALAYIYYKFFAEHQPNEVFVTYTVVMPTAKKKLTGTVTATENSTATAKDNDASFRSSMTAKEERSQASIVTAVEEKNVDLNKNEFGSIRENKSHRGSKRETNAPADTQ